MNTILQKRIEEVEKKIIQERVKSFRYENGMELEPLIKTFLEKIGTVFFEHGISFALQNQWISVEEALPPYDKAVIGMDYMPELTWDDQTIIFVHRSDNPNVVTDKNKFCVYPPSFCKVTHWMEIPSLEGDEK